MVYFFYGTLMDRDVLRRVIGRTIGAGCLVPAVLEGYTRVHRAHGPYPVVVAKAGGRVEGCLMDGIGRRGAARIARFEGGEYVLRPLTVHVPGRGTVRARVFVPRPSVRLSGKPWDPQFRGQYIF